MLLNSPERRDGQYDQMLVVRTWLIFYYNWNGTGICLGKNRTRSAREPLAMKNMGELMNTVGQQGATHVDSFKFPIGIPHRLQPTLAPGNDFVNLVSIVDYDC